MTRNPWNRVPLASVCASADDIKCGPFGTQLNKHEFREEGVPLWGIKQVNVGFSIPTKEFLEPRTAKRLQQYDLRPGDIVMTRKGTVGNCAVYPDHFDVGIMHSDLLRLRVDSARCEPSFLVHQLHYSPDVERQLLLISGGAIMPGINVGRLKQLEVVLPPLAEQRRIAEVLDRAEALRTKRRAALAQLDALTQSLFLDLFGDPATNTKRFPKHPLASLIRDDDTINYGVVQPGDDLDEGVPLVRVGDLIDGKVRHSELKRIAPSIEAAYKRSRLRGDEILVSCVGSIGVVALANDSVKGFNIARAVARIPLAETTNRVFMAAYLRTDFVQRYFTNELRTVSQPTLNIKQLSETTVVLPPLPLQREFARRVAAVEKLKAAQRASLAELDALFATLQHRAFRGEL